MKLFHRHSGSGKPVIILHGLFGLSDNWVTFGRSLSDWYSVYIPDLRNHGQSPHSPIFDFPALEHDLVEFIEDHGLHDFYLLGHSLGGKLSMIYTLHYPDLVEKLVVADISLRRSPPNREHQLLLNAMSAVNFDEVRSRSDVEKQLSATVHNPKLRMFLLKSVYWRTRDRLDWRLNLNAINNNLLSVFEGVDIPGICEKPALFIRGGQSDYVLNEDIPRITEKFPRAAVETIANASHWVHADAPQEFLEIVSGFFRRDQ